MSFPPPEYICFRCLSCSRAPPHKYNPLPYPKWKHIAYPPCRCPHTHRYLPEDLLSRSWHEQSYIRDELPVIFRPWPGFLSLVYTKKWNLRYWREREYFVIRNGNELRQKRMTVSHSWTSPRINPGSSKVIAAYFTLGRNSSREKSGMSRGRTEA